MFESKGWLNAQRTPGGYTEVCGKRYKLVYRERQLRENAKALVVLAILRDEADEEFDLAKVVDEIGLPKTDLAYFENMEIKVLEKPER